MVIYIHARRQQTVLILWSRVRQQFFPDTSSIPFNNATNFGNKTMDCGPEGLNLGHH